MRPAQLSLFPDPLDHDCLVDGSFVRGWRGRWLRTMDVERFPDPMRVEELHESDLHVATAGEPKWCRVLCDPVRVQLDGSPERYVAHVRFDGAQRVSNAWGCLLIADVRELAALSRPRRRRRRP